MAFKQRYTNDIFEKRKLQIPAGALLQLLCYYDNWRKASKSVRNNGIEIKTIEDALYRAMKESLHIRWVFLLTHDRTYRTSQHTLILRERESHLSEYYLNKIEESP